MKLCLKFLLVLLLSQQISSCKWFSEAGTPINAWVGMKVPDGTPTFKKGFVHGCGNAYYTRGNQFYRTFYKYQYDPKKIDDPEYRFGVQRGYSYCFNYTLGGAGPNFPADRYFFPIKDPSELSSGYSINDVGLFDGLQPLIGTDSSSSIDGLFEMWAGKPGTSALGGDPLWGSGSKGQIFGQ